MAYSVNPNDFVMKLNNLLQAQGRLNALTWRESAAGPAHGPEWTITAFSGSSVVPQHFGLYANNAIWFLFVILVGNEEYGWGTHKTKQGARHEAARMALQHMSYMEMVDE